MQLLTIETTGRWASVALTDGEGVSLLEISRERMNHLSNLFVMIRELLKKRALQIGDITCIAVSAGPGSFTGIRIGVSAARALAQALDLPMIPVPTLEAFVFQGSTASAAGPDSSGGSAAPGASPGPIAAPLFDARRSQVYAGAYRLEGGGIRTLVEGKAWELPEYLTRLAEKADGSVVFYGDGIDAYPEEVLSCIAMLKARGIPAAPAGEEMQLQRADAVGRLALRLFREGKQVPYEQVTPMYMRKAEAERRLEEGCPI